MASIGSVSTSTSNSIRGYGGLASGLDRDELIKGMTIGTTTKITQQEQKKQKTEWMQEAVRAISDKMISFHGKYTETLTSSSNLFSGVLWGRNKITTNGENSKYVSISGTASTANAMTIMGIKQRAQNASWSSVEGASTGEFSGKAVTIDSAALDQISGQKLKFSYNGTEAEIELPTKEEIESEAAKPGNNTETVIQKSIQDQLNAAFGKDRIKVEYNNNKFSFRTVVPGEYEKDEEGNDTNTAKSDKSSVLTLIGGDDAAIDALGLKKNTSTRLSLDGDLGSKVVDSTITINGTDIDISGCDTVRKVMEAINAKKNETGVTVSYQETADKFIFTSSENGASGAIRFDAGVDTVNNIFGLKIGETVDGKTVGPEKRGQDAIVAVKYAGSDEVVELRRDSNTFTVDGLTLSLKGTFGYDENDVLISKNNLTQAVEVTATVDVDKLMSTIKSFVDEYNEIVDLVNSELTTKHEKDYDPLTSDQKSELSEDEIEKWEKKAKEGLLYGDSDLRSLSMDLRVVVSGGLLVKFEEIGISLSSSYSDNGKLSIDESKLRAALETDPEKVQDLFTSEEAVDENGKYTSYNGLARNLKNVMDKYVKTMGSMETKGILIRKAGSKSSPQSLTQNTYYNQITSIEKLIDQLKTRLKKEQDRYISQFSSLETLIANMNSQSSYLSSMSGY